MTECVHLRTLCGAHRESGENVHRCFLGVRHDGPHVCVCWFRWVAA